MFETVEAQHSYTIRMELARRDCVGRDYPAARLRSNVLIHRFSELAAAIFQAALRERHRTTPPSPALP